MLQNFLAAIDGGLLAIIILDVVLILAVAGLFLWLYLKKSKKRNIEMDSSIEKLDDDTYVMPNEEVAPVEDSHVVYEDDNAVLHFVNQITDINEEVNNELNSTAVIVNHEVEQPSQRIVKKDEIENFVMIGGEKKTKNDEQKAATLNRGTNAFKNATNFVNQIKNEQIVEDEQPQTTKKTTKKK